jgi:predicted small secreted protein
MSLLRPKTAAAILIAFSLVLMACGNDPAGLGRDLVGEYTLLRWNGSPLPVRLPNHDRFGNRLPCDALIDEERLVLGRPGGEFRLAYRYVNACTQEVFRRSEIEGSYQQHGDSLDFHVETAGPPYSFAGSIAPSRALVREYVLMEFGR